MGTKVQSKSYLPQYYSMRDLNEDSNGCSWPLYYGDKTLTNGQYYNGFLPRNAADVYSGYDKDVVKQTMLEHEAIFKNQVYELHRLYRIQRDLMDEIKRKELHKNRMPVETSFSSSPLASQITSEDARKWHIPSFPLANSVCARPSISGVEDSHSPMSSVKGSSTQAAPLPSQNGGGSKDLEVLESRPAKVRRKMIDLHLPADEYIDVDEAEQFRDDTVSGMSSYLPNGHLKTAPQSGEKLFHDEGGKAAHQGDSLRSGSCVRSTNCLADLNEPIPIEATNGSACAYPLGHVSCHEEIKGHEPSVGPKIQLLGLPKEICLNGHRETSNGTVNNSLLEETASGRGWFCHVVGAGNNKSSQISVSPDLQLEKLPISSQPVQVLFPNACEPPSFPTNQSKPDLWRHTSFHGLETGARNHETSHCNHMESGVTSNAPSSYPIGPPDSVGSWNHLVSSWENHSSSLSQKSMPLFNSSGTLSNFPQTSASSHGILGDRWHPNNNYRGNSSYGSELPNQNGLHNGSSSGSKDPSVHFPIVSYNYLNCRNDNNVTSEHAKNHGSGKFHQGPNSMDAKSAKDVNLKVALSNSSLHKPDLDRLDGARKHEDHLAVLPWLRAKPSCKTETTSMQRDLSTEDSSFLTSSLDHLVNNVGPGKGANQTYNQTSKSVASSNNVEASRIGINDCPSNRKILGFPIFDKTCFSKDEPSSLSSPSVSIPHPSGREENKGKNRVFDINLPCDAAVPDLGQHSAEVLVVEERIDKNVASSRHHIDLNLCVNEDDASFSPRSPNTNVKNTSGIDLEVPVVLETAEDVCGDESPKQVHEELLTSSECKDDHSLDELNRIAAEAIVAISSSGQLSNLDAVACGSSEASLTDPLQWFVEIIYSCGEDLERKVDTVLRVNDGGDVDESSSEGIDFFESMTLKLTETKEEDYMPTPLVPENLKLEETAATLVASRPRKGHARRGRQRRDFQRDILPGLASLSRHEVTEDLQTFGGLMRATGHSWHSGLTRRNSTRNGCGRGRRRMVNSPSPAVAATTACPPLVQQLNNIEVGLEDRSLTGWGKTTRRPRRQRCPAGNPPFVPLT